MGARNNKIIKVIIIAFGFICLVSLYIYLTRPINISNLINVSTIKDIDMQTHISSSIKTKLPEELTLKDNKDISAFVGILSKYRYSKILKYYNPHLAPSNSADGVININIVYINDNGEYRLQYLCVDSENNVIIRNKNNINIEFKISGEDKNLFEDLSSWLRLKL